MKRMLEEEKERREFEEDHMVRLVSYVKFRVRSEV